jgi:hypothetical protein
MSQDNTAGTLNRRRLAGLKNRLAFSWIKKTARRG